MNSRTKVINGKDLEILNEWETSLQQKLLTMGSDKPFTYSVTMRCLGHIQNVKSVQNQHTFTLAYEAAKADCNRLLKINSSNQVVNLLLNQLKELVENIKINIAHQTEVQTHNRTRQA